MHFTFPLKVICVALICGLYEWLTANIYIEIYKLRHTGLVVANFPKHIHRYK